ncbi:tetratricopeptide repeat protein [Mycolicibacterium sp. 22603]|uniref:tetratricopeptide repeat protein n=1 Tax=Mycolicibacterium sp. 22603 TaxID=3453950 RepID=UPI003F8562E5
MADDIAARGGQALTLYGQGRVQEALTLAWQTAAAHPDSPLAQYTYASLLREAGRHAEALAVVDQALRLYPASADAWVLRGDLQQKVSGLAAAEPDYLQALRIDPGHGLAVHNLAVSRLRWGTNTAALRGLLQAMRMDPALTQTALGNIGLAITRVLRMATASTVLLAAAMFAIFTLHEQGQSTVLARLFTGLLAAAPIAAVCWTLRMVPIPVLRAVSARHTIVALRLIFLVLAGACGLVVAVLGATWLSTVAPALLLFAMVGLTILGWVSGG